MVKKASSVRLLQFTDTHLFGSDSGRICGVNTAAALALTLAHARRFDQTPDAVLATGDLSQDTSRASYERFVSVFESLGVPVHCLPGNHDDPRLMAEVFVGSLSVHHTRWADFGTWRIVMLDSVIPGENGGRVSSSELAFLDRTLGEMPVANALVCLHHNPVAMGSRWLDRMMVNNASEFFRVIDRHPRVRGVLWGHVHQEYQEVRAGRLLMCTPSTCAQFLPKSETFGVDAASPGYRVLDLHPDGKIVTEVHRIPAGLVTPDPDTRGY